MSAYADVERRVPVEGRSALCARQARLQSAHYMARNSFLSTLPAALRGRASVKTTVLGIL